MKRAEVAELNRFAWEWANREYDGQMRAHLVRNNAFLRALAAQDCEQHARDMADKHE